MSRILIAILGLSACTTLLYDDRCGPESRDVTAGEVIPTTQGDSIGLAWITLVETRERDVRSVSWYISGAALRGHLQSARLVATEDASSLLLPLPGVPAEPDIIIEGHLDPYTGPVDFNRLFERARTGGLTMILETDMPTGPVIAVPLQEVVQFNDWGRAHCS